MKKFAIAFAAVLALFIGTATAGHHNTVTVIRQVNLVGGAYGCGSNVSIVRNATADTCSNDTVALADNYNAGVRIVRVNGGYHNNVAIINTHNHGFQVIRGRAVRVNGTGGNSGVVGAVKVIANTAGNLIGDIIGN